MSMVRLTFTIEEDLAEELRAAVPAGEVSSFVAEAVRQRLRVEPLRALLLDLDKAYGTLADSDLAEGEQWFDQLMRQLSSTPEP